MQNLDGPNILAFSVNNTGGDQQIFEIVNKRLKTTHPNTHWGAETSHWGGTPKFSEEIQSKGILIFGGPLNWRQKLKEHLPTLEFVDVDEKNRDISKIQRVDAVFINTGVFSHAFYKKIIKELRNSDTLLYLNGQSNFERTVLEIYECLTE